MLYRWSSEEAAQIIKRKVVHLTFDKTYKYIVRRGKVIRSIEEEDMSNHEEADTKMIYHVCNIQETKDIIIRSSDTDVLIIMLGNMHNMTSESNVWILYGTGNIIFYLFIMLSVCESR